MNNYVDNIKFYMLKLALLKIIKGDENYSYQFKNKFFNNVCVICITCSYRCIYSSACSIYGLFYSSVSICSSCRINFRTIKRSCICRHICSNGALWFTNIRSWRRLDLHCKT
ncbi:hypothetical protein CTC_01862 [Clostridium tetani E88]|uniref:Uncharacterized protein n=1 Tax=Clostridium tetani (strain Massachusetts / E88) TaxID=212717 RepID=Q893G2_CLOTE|nr:hypothetical protein CTC_01862 [Clostridium tetani E88]